MSGRSAKSPKVIEVNCCLPQAGWIKGIIDGTTNDSPSIDGRGGIFGTSRGFFKSNFAYYLDMFYAFEAKLWVAVYAIEFARKFLGCLFGWNQTLPLAYYSLN